jgi:hypothetical protein
VILLESEEQGESAASVGVSWWNSSIVFIIVIVKRMTFTVKLALLAFFSFPILEMSIRASLKRKYQAMIC